MLAMLLLTPDVIVLVFDCCYYWRFDIVLLFIVRGVANLFLEPSGFFEAALEKRSLSYYYLG